MSNSRPSGYAEILSGNDAFITLESLILCILSGVVANFTIFTQPPIIREGYRKVNAVPLIKDSRAVHLILQQANDRNSPTVYPA
jgi:hypothetical protein